MVEKLNRQLRLGEGGKDSEFRDVWDTSYVDRRDRFSFFREGICQAFLSFSPEKPANGGLEARVEKAHLQRGSVGRIDVTPHIVRRTPSDLAKLPGEYFHLSMKLRGSSRVEIGKEAFEYNSGDILLMDPKCIKTFIINPNCRSSSINVVFEKSLLDGFNVPDEQNHFMLSGHAFLDPLKACLHLINERYANASLKEMNCLFDASVSLLTARLLKDREFLEEKCISSSGTRTGLLHVIKKFIRCEISDATLSVESVASKFGISGRYVQMLFQEDGTTFKSYLTSLRLSCVQTDLLNPANSDVAVAEIAFRWGFRDKTTFHRNFKARFGSSPAHMRGMVS